MFQALQYDVVNKELIGVDEDFDREWDITRLRESKKGQPWAWTAIAEVLAKRAHETTAGETGRRWIDLAADLTDLQPNHLRRMQRIGVFMNEHPDAAKALKLDHRRFSIAELLMRFYLLDPTEAELRAKAPKLRNHELQAILETRRDEVAAQSAFSAGRQMAADFRDHVRQTLHQDMKRVGSDAGIQINFVEPAFRFTYANPDFLVFDAAKTGIIAIQAQAIDAGKARGHLNQSIVQIALSATFFDELIVVVPSTTPTENRHLSKEIEALELGNVRVRRQDEKIINWPPDKDRPPSPDRRQIWRHRFLKRLD